MMRGVRCIIPAYSIKGGATRELISPARHLEPSMQSTQLGLNSIVARTHPTMTTSHRPGSILSPLSPRRGGVVGCLLTNRRTVGEQGPTSPRPSPPSKGGEGDVRARFMGSNSENSFRGSLSPNPVFRAASSAETVHPLLERGDRGKGERRVR